MRAIGLSEFGGPDVLKVVELPEPHAGRGQIRIRVRAAAVNPADTLLRAGAHARSLNAVPGPYVPGMDVAGIVDEIGAGTTTDLTRDDPVMAMILPVSPRPDGTLDYHGGAYAEYVVLPAPWVVRAPAGMDHTATATLPMNGLTALLTLDQLALPAGSTLAVTGAAGTVGSYLTQMASAAGIIVVGDAAPADEVLVRESGAAQIVARGDGLARRIRSHHRDGVDAVADAALIGPQLLDAVRDGGSLAMLGGVAESTPRVTVRHPFVPDYAGRTDRLAEIRRLAESGVLVPRVAGVLPAAEAPAAHRRLEAGGVRGRFVLTF